MANVTHLGYARACDSIKQSVGYRDAPKLKHDIRIRRRCFILLGGGSGSTTGSSSIFKSNTTRSSINRVASSFSCNFILSTNFGFKLTVWLQTPDVARVVTFLRVAAHVSAGWLFHFLVGEINLSTLGVKTQNGEQLDNRMVGSQKTANR